MLHRIRVDVAILAALILALTVTACLSKDRGQFGASSPERRAWFQGLHSGKGPCCADADGQVLTDLEWKSDNGHYQVQINGEWIDVPDDAVLKEPNMDGRTIVWPIYTDGHPKIRCFIPGSMT